MTQHIYDIEVKDINGEIFTLNRFAGFTLLIVNVASNCKFAKAAYESMTVLLQKFHKDGLRILLFPCSQFLNQEFKTAEEIKNFAEKYSSDFILMAPIEVRGPNAHILFKFMCEKLQGTLTNDVKWNFTYFLIGSKGEPVSRYSPLQGISENDENLLRCLKESKKNMKGPPDAAKATADGQETASK